MNPFLSSSGQQRGIVDSLEARVCSDVAASPQTATDRSRIRGYLRGDPETLRLVEHWVLREIDGHYGFLRPFSEDLCQTVHAKLLANLRDGRFRQRSSLESYVSRIAQYTAVDFMRRGWREGPLESPERDPRLEDPYRRVLRLEIQEQVHRAIHLAPESCRELWRMVFLERLSYGEIAQRLNVPEGTVKSRAWNCRQKLGSLFRRIQGISSVKR
jgi:RNA polymerase sigma-70 factor (ECF subfamily)